MSEIPSTDWDETAASNNQGSPDGFPEGMAPSGVNDSMREAMAAIKREYNRSHPTRTSGGAGSLTFTVSYSVNPSAYTRGDIYSFKAHQNCGNAARFGVSGLSTKLMMKPTKGGLVTISQSDIVTDQIVKLAYDTSLDAMVMISMIGLPSTIGTVQMVIAGAGISGGSISSTGTIALDFNELTLTSSISLSDIIPFYDGSNHRAATVTNIISKAAATQAQLEAGSSTAVFTSPGRQQFHPSAAKAWGVFDGSVSTLSTTFVASYGMTSVSKHATGHYIITLATPFSSANYCVQGTASRSTVLVTSLTGSISVGGFAIEILDAPGTNVNSQYVSVVCFGDQ